MHYLSTFTFQWQYFVGISARAANADLLSLPQYSLAVVFSAVRQGLRLLERWFAWTAARGRGNRWRCPGRSEQTSPLQAFLEQNLMIWVVGRVSERLTECLGAFLPPAAESLLPGLAAGLLCTLPLLFLLINNTGDSWLVHRVHKPVSSNYFLMLLMCFEEREIKKNYGAHPQPAATHCNAVSSRFVFSLKIRVTKRWTWWWTEKLPPCPACWVRIKNHSQPGDFSLNSSSPC